MKKPYNAFKATRLTNMIRLLAAVCLGAIVIVLILYVSVAKNRQEIVSWFGIRKADQDVAAPAITDTRGLGLTQSATVNENIQVRPIDQKDHLWGPIDAPVSLIIYDDFECPFCAQLYETVNRAKSEFGNSLVVVVRHFPLMSHEQAIPAAMAAECAGEQNKFWDMYHLLYEDNKSGKLSQEEYLKNSEELKLTAAPFSECLTKEKYKDKILAEKAEVKDLGVIGTPASFINNQYLPGALPYEDFSYPDGSAALGLR